MKVIFITDGIESAIEQAKVAAGDRDVLTIGGADISRQILAKGLADELNIGIAPFPLGEGLRFFDGVGLEKMKLQKIDEKEAAG